MRSLPFSQIAVVSIVGVLSGVYIYKPLLIRYQREQLVKNQKLPQDENSGEETRTVEAKKTESEHSGGESSARTQDDSDL